MRKVFWLMALAWPVVLAGEPGLTHKDVFTAGEGGYHSFRIPALVAAPDGSLVAFAEARKENREDPGGGDIDLVAKRSTDQGESWSAMRVVDDPGEKWAASNPTPVVDAAKKRLLIVYNRWEPGYGTARSQPGTMNNQTWVRSSDDNGLTWSAGRDITSSARDVANWGAIFVGPGGAIQSRKGRLLIPAAMSPDTYGIQMSLGGFHGLVNFMRAYCLYSDDGGASWQRGSLVRALTNENQLVELADGAILMDARQGPGEHRWVAVSGDGGQTWSNPRPGQQVGPVATAIERWDKERILWTGPTGPGRRNLVVRVSHDEGQTFANERVIYGGLAAYSDLAILKDGTAGVLWERGVSDGYQFVTFTKLGQTFWGK
ncbi:MAG: exo-alpha-sialidase [Acidobacteria bacterium]|nr:exo-alpha-sialidase [Acidobacteriota bacterium]